MSSTFHANAHRFIDRAHTLGMAVLLDVVYNHIGPEGNPMPQCSDHFFAPEGATPWGRRLNIDWVTIRECALHIHMIDCCVYLQSRDSRYAPVLRRFIIENALYWLREFHFDGFRVDAIHAIEDESEPHLWRQLTDECKTFARENSRMRTVPAETYICLC